MWYVRSILVSQLKSSQAAGNEIFPLEKLCLLCLAFTYPQEGHALTGNFHFWPEYALAIQAVLLPSVSSQRI